MRAGVYVCVCTCVCDRVCVYVRACVRARARARMCVFMCVQACVHVCARVCVRARVCMSLRSFAHLESSHAPWAPCLQRKNLKRQRYNQYFLKLSSELTFEKCLPIFSCPAINWQRFKKVSSKKKKREGKDLLSYFIVHRVCVCVCV